MYMYDVWFFFSNPSNKLAHALIYLQLKHNRNSLFFSISTASKASSGLLVMKFNVGSSELTSSKENKKKPQIMIKTTSMRHGWRKNWEFSKIREWSTHLRLHIWNLWYTGNLPEKENLPVSRAVNLVTILQKRTVMMAMLSTSVLSIPITKKMVRMFYSRIVVFRVPFCLD